MKKIIFTFFKFFIIIIIIGMIFILGLGIYFLLSPKISFNMDVIRDNNLSIEIYNNQNLLIDEYNSFNTVKISLDNLQDYTKQAFISIEDKDFYNHNGISIKRMGKAFIKNLSNFQILEGASTISQQLIKNTFLTNEKTFSRKLNEIKLALELEKNLSKNEILENYLNVIYFGNNCYGIENASQYYFSKSANKLSIGESATLAGLIKSPNKYSPIKNPKLSIKRRNLVLKEMKKDGYINDNEYSNEIEQPINLKINNNSKNKLNSYSQSALDEAVKILKMPEKQIAIAGYKIYTYQNLDRQICLDGLIKNKDLENKDFSFIDIDTKTGGILAYIGKSDYKILDYKRQPASTIKPILIYAPAINEDIITPATLILDEKISIDGYSPKNIGDTYHGYVSVRESLSKSLNIPAIKTASYLGFSKIEKYANKLNIPLNKNDYNYSLALGGMTYGTNLKELAGAYTALANYGMYQSPKFVNYITNKDGKIIYKNQDNGEKIFREDTAYLMTDMLKTCVQNGTSKKLNSLNFDIAGKTGTVGDFSGNTDAYSISYTTENIVGVWVGRMDNKKIDCVGGTLPTILAKNYYDEIYKTYKPKNFTRPSSIKELDIDLTEYNNNHNVVIANPLTPERYKFKEIFSRFNLPSQQANKILTSQPANLNGFIKNNTVYLNFEAKDYLTYEVYKNFKSSNILLQTVKGQNGEISIEDTIQNNEKASYYIITKLYSPDGEILINEEKSNMVNLFNLTNTTDNIIKNKWYI